MWFLQNESLHRWTLMGKASRWIRNILGVKREEKCKKTFDLVSGDNVETSSTATLPVTTPKEKRRWSFGHKSPVALPFSVSNPLINEQAPDMAVAAAATATAQTTFEETNEAAGGRHSMVEHVAATKIQAIFRSYLVLLQTLIESHF